MALGEGREDFLEVEAAVRLSGEGETVSPESFQLGQGHRGRLLWEVAWVLGADCAWPGLSAKQRASARDPVHNIRQAAR